MFSPYSKTPLSSVKAQQKLSKPSPYFSPSIRRSMTPGFSRNSSFGLSFDTSVGDVSILGDQLVAYESVLPVLVTEAITLAERSTDISVKLEPFGYASLVCGRQLFIWKYKPDSDKSFVHCKELTLPPSDLAHKADLVHLFQTEDSNLPSAVAVSPEGHVRYWPNINHEGSSVDAQPDLQGQECCSLTSINPLGCVLATTSSSLVILTPTIGEGQPNVICRPLTLPLGVLAGIGRKVSSFIFGSIPAQTAETKQLNRVVSVQNSYEDHFLYVLSTNTLQKWVISRKKENSDQLLFEMDLDPLLKQAYAGELLGSEPTLVSRLKTWSIDMQLCGSGVVIFAAGAVPSRPDESIHYSFGVLDVRNDQPPEKFSFFHITKYCEPYQESVEEKTLSYKLLLPNLDSSSAYIYNFVKALCFQYKVPQSDFSEVDFSNSDNAILGSGTCEGTPLFFTRFYGIVSYQPNRKALEDSRLIESMKEVSFMQTDPSEASESLSAKLKAAMLAHGKNDNEKSQLILSEILSSSTSFDGSLDEAVVGLDLGIIDDYPVSDPRWCESLPTMSASTSLIISYQLEDKLKVHNYFMSFLKTFNLLERLSTSRIADFKIPTNVLLCEHAEKIVAAKAIRMFLTDHLDIIEFAVIDALDRQGKEVKNHLTPQDVFFREVSAFHTIFPSLIGWENEQINADESVSQTLYALMTVNKIFVGLLEAINDYRANSKEIYGLQNDDDFKAEYLPWTSRKGNSGIRLHIKEQLEINTRNFTHLTDNLQIQGVLYQQYVVMLDFYLGTYYSHLKSLDKEQASILKKEFVSERSSFLKPLVDAGQHERAAAIAEKYLDFDVLTQICNDSKSVERLQRYMHQFSEHNFSEFVFKWYLDKGKKSKLFDKHLGQREVLGNFLKDHESLKWIYYIQDKKYDAAHLTLKQLALKETEFLKRKKTLLSLSKLCAMISEVNASIKTNQIKAINSELDLISHQEALPLSVVEAYGIDPKNMRVFPPEELVEMYITDENATANAYDFKIALDILNFIKKPLDDPEVYNLRMHIWAKAILRDNWETLDINNPLDAVKETVFFQVIELAFNKGVDVHDFMPDFEELLQAPELSDLAENPSFKFLIQAGYEHILKIID